jgi:hypothetical protein
VLPTYSVWQSPGGHSALMIAIEFLRFPS